MNAFEPVTWSVRRPSADSSATRLTAMTDFPVPGPAGDDERDLLLVLAGGADRVHDRVEGDLLFVEEREHGLVLDDARDVVEQALVRAEGGVGDSLEDAHRRPGRLRAPRGSRRARRVWSPVNAGFVARSDAKAGRTAATSGRRCALWR